MQDSQSNDDAFVEYSSLGEGVGEGIDSDGQQAIGHFFGPQQRQGVPSQRHHDPPAEHPIRQATHPCAHHKCITPPPLSPNPKTLTHSPFLLL